MSQERDELALELFIGDNANQPRETSIQDWTWFEVARKAQGQVEHYKTMAEHALAAGYRKPCQVTTEEELDALPPGSVVLSLSYLGQPSGQRISFQRWADGDWHRGARSGSTHPDNFLPATVLHVGGAE